MGVSSHRLGGSTSLITRLALARAPVAEMLAAAADPSQCAAVASTARLVVRTTEGQQEFAVSQARSLVPDDLMATRRPPSHGRMRNYIGRCAVPSSNGPTSVWFESLNELSHMRDLLMTGVVDALASQPALVIWTLPSGHRQHFPDMLVRHHSDRLLLCEVSTKKTLTNPEALAQYALMAATAEVCGWDFQLRTELPAQRLRNQSFLHAYRHASAEQQAGWLTALADAHWPLQLVEVANELGGGAVGKAAALHLIAVGALFTDLDPVLRPDTWVHSERPEEARPAWMMQM